MGHLTELLAQHPPARTRLMDPELFELFLTPGVYCIYAQRFVRPEQMDRVDIAQYLTA